MVIAGMRRHVIKLLRYMAKLCGRSVEDPLHFSKVILSISPARLEGRIPRLSAAATFRDPIRFEREIALHR